MVQDLIVKNHLRVGRYFKDYGVAREPLSAVYLMVRGQVKQPIGFMIDMYKIQDDFNRSIGYCWNNKILAQRDQCIPEAVKPLVYVKFSPSIENIAKVVYDEMYQGIKRKYGVTLVEVRALTEIGEAIYPVE